MPLIEIGPGTGSGPTIDSVWSAIAYRDEGPRERSPAREAAAGPETLLLLHSSASSGCQWRNLRTRASGRQRCLTPDFYGYGESAAWPKGRPHDLAGEAGVVYAMMALAGRPVHLVGHSYGGAVALRAALKRPDRVASLTLIEPVAFHLLANSDPRGGSLLGEIHRLAESIGEALSRDDPDAALKPFLDYWGGAGAWDRMEAAKRARLRASAPKLALDFRAVLGEPSSLRDYAGIAAPCHLICGSDSPAPVRRLVDLLAAVLPRAAVSRVAGAGHRLPLTHPEIVNRLVLDQVQNHAVNQRLAA